MIGVI
jgi:hypothetical protein